MTITPRLPREEALYRSEGTGGRGKRVLWRPKRKSVSWMKNLLRKFSRAEDEMIKIFAGTSSTAKALMLLDQHRRFVKFNLDSDVVTAADTCLLVAFALQVLNPSLGITEDEKMRAPARAFKKKMSIGSA